MLYDEKRVNVDVAALWPYAHNFIVECVNGAVLLEYLENNIILLIVVEIRRPLLYIIILYFSACYRIE